MVISKKFERGYVERKKYEKKEEENQPMRG